MSFLQLVAAGLLLLAQSRPDLYDESKLVTIQPADATSPYAGFFDLAHPEIIWINAENVYNTEMMRGQLAHELTHHHDWRMGTLTMQTCGEDYVQAELRAFRAQSNWQPWQEGVMLGYVRGNYQNLRPCL